MHFLSVEIMRNLARHFGQFFDEERNPSMSFVCEDKTISTQDKKLNGIYTLASIVIPDERFRKRFGESAYRCPYNFTDGRATEDVLGNPVAYSFGESFVVKARPTKIDITVQINRDIAFEKIDKIDSNAAGSVQLYLSSGDRDDSQVQKTKGSSTLVKIRRRIGVVFTMPINEEDNYYEVWGEREGDMIAMCTSATGAGVTMVNFLRVVGRSILNKRYILELEYEYDDVFDYRANLEKNVVSTTVKEIKLEGNTKL